MINRSASHQEAFRELSLIEQTVLDFLLNLEEDADNDLQASIEDVKEAVLNA
jgi:hypothetical protein